MITKTALVQLNASDDPAANLPITQGFIREAALGGAQFVLTPEVTNCLSSSRRHQQAVLQHQDEDQTLKGLRVSAAEHGIWLLIGSLALKTQDADGRFANRSFLIAPDGSIKAWYDKIHMFDVQVGDGHQYRESHTYQPGEEPVLVDTPWGRFGMTICYDIRFAYLYRKLAHAGAKMIFAPAAFTKVTGEAHWHVLQRARAIETGTFIVSAAQTGTHEGGRQTYGHSVIVDPWGKILSDGGEEVGVSMAEVDLAEVEAARGKVPSLTHDRELGEPVAYGEALREAGE